MLKNMNKQLIVNYQNLTLDEKNLVKSKINSFGVKDDDFGFMIENKELRDEMGLDAHLYLQQITSHPSVSKVLENYYSWINSHENPKPGQTGFYKYIIYNNMDGIEFQKRYNKECLFNKYLSKVDFKTGEKYKELPKEKDFIEGFKLIISDEKSKEFDDYLRLKPIREKIINNYLSWFEKSEKLHPSKMTLANYLRKHNIKGELEPVRKKTLEVYHMIDFRTENFTHSNPNSLENTINSIMYDFEGDEIDKINSLNSFKKEREQIFNNYISWINSLENPSYKNTRLSKYFRTHNLKGEKVAFFKDSIVSYYNWDFEKKEIRKNKTEDEAIRCLTKGLENSLVEKFEKYHNLVPVRENIIRNYMGWKENHKRQNSIGLIEYLGNHSYSGEKVKKNSAKSMVPFIQFDYRDNRTFALKQDSRSIIDTIDSLTSGIDLSLNREFRDFVSKYK